MKLKRMALAGAFVAAISIPALAAGLWSQLPILGGNSFCGAYIGSTPSVGGITGQGAGSTICAGTVPAGPQALTGLELIPADTQLSGGQSPQTVVIPSSMLGVQRTNRLIGADFNTNLWQRGTTFSSLTPTTTTMTADRWGVYSSGNTVTVTKQTGASDSIPTLGLYASMRVNRPSASDVTPICVVQVLDKKAAAPLIGNNAIFSFYALAGSTFSPTASNLNVTVAYYTAADSATPGTNTDSFAKGTITNYTAAAVAASPGTTGTVTAGVVAVPISTTWTRYSIAATIPTATAAGTAVTGVGVSICNTPVGTGASTDWFEFEAAQLEAHSSVTTNAFPLGVLAPRGFEKRYPAEEALLQYGYSFILTEPATSVAVSVGSLTTTTNCRIAYPLPALMRTAPTFTSGTITSSVTWRVRGQNTANNISALATSTANTVNQLSLDATVVTALTAGNACILEGNSGASLPVASAEP